VAADIGVGTPAASVGIRRGDLLLAIDDRPVQQMSDVVRMLQTADAGQTVRYTMLRLGTREVVDLRIAPIPSGIESTCGGLGFVTYTEDTQPIYFNKCDPCHTTFGLGGHNIGTNYEDALQPADNPACTGLTVGACTIVRIQSGEMPEGAGCTGDPDQDADNPACTTQHEQDLIQAWIDGGLPE